ncbi:hypothetical protein SY94_7001 [Agrobacterium tumefaciens]|nr:hypothetical protein SY94_7001 [Agrobacterium tumefaciens]
MRLSETKYAIAVKRTITNRNRMQPAQEHCQRINNIFT